GVFTDTATNISDTVAASSTVCDGSFNCTTTIPLTPGKRIGWYVEAQKLIDGINYTSYALRSTYDYPAPVCALATDTIIFSGKAFLQGAYNSGTGLMSNTLNTLGILQTNAASQPYNTAEFSYAGTEIVGAGFFAAHTDIVDWVLIELRDANIPATVVKARAAFVKQDGTLVDTNGTATQIIFPGVADGNYFISVRHRNHLGIASASALSIKDTATYDFTKPSSQTFGVNGRRNQDGVMLLWGGDANLNKTTSYNGSANDKNAILAKVGLPNPNNVINGYHREDVNMDGSVRYNGAANDKNAVLSIVGLLFPNNIILGQIPN
ncbi:MAG TPA: hypothetical protein VM884_07090, partial [Flavisolibacter sp.]|nr:hypothetical protein [Flavisolibacter sp.]